MCIQTQSVSFELYLPNHLFHAYQPCIRGTLILNWFCTPKRSMEEGWRRRHVGWLQISEVFRACEKRRKGWQITWVIYYRDVLFGCRAEVRIMDFSRFSTPPPCLCVCLLNLLLGSKVRILLWLETCDWKVSNLIQTSTNVMWQGP